MEETAITAPPRAKQGFHLTREQVFFLFLAAAAVVARLIAWSWSPLLERDSVGYVNAAAVWAATGKYVTPQFPPLPCFLIQLLIRLGLEPETAARLYAFLPGCLVPLMGYAVALESSGSRRVARYAAVLLLFHPMLLYFAAEPMRDSLYILLAGGALWAGIRALRSRLIRCWLLFGCLCGLGWTCRHEMLEFLPLTVIGLVIEVWRKRYAWPRALLHFLIFIAVTGLLWFGITLSLGGKTTFDAQSGPVKAHFRDFLE